MLVTVTCRIPGAQARADHLAREAAAELERYFKRIILIEWIFEEDADHTVVRSRIHSQSGYYRAEAASADMQSSVVAVLQKLEKQRRRRKELRVTHRRRTQR